jgi:hypothetical protein
MSDPVAGSEKPRVPVTAKDRVTGIVVALVLLGLGAAMILWPDLGLVPADADPSGRGGRKVVGLLKIAEMVWSRPVGGIAGVLGLLVAFGSLTNKTKAAD